MNVFPIAYFGNLVYYKQLVDCKSVVFETEEHFVKQTFRTRCEILGPNDLQTLSVPVKKINGSKTSISELEIVEDGWRKMHWKAIETAYASSPFFDYYGIEVNELIYAEISNYLEFIKQIHKRICTWLDLPLDYKYSISYCDIRNSSDFRNDGFEMKKSLNFENYTQVFRERNECVLNLSILDLIFNQGPLARNWIVDTTK